MVHLKPYADECTAVADMQDIIAVTHFTHYVLHIHYCCGDTIWPMHLMDTAPLNVPVYTHHMHVVNHTRSVTVSETV